LLGDADFISIYMCIYVLYMKCICTAAVWMNNATLALLALYEANMGMLDHPKKKTKIWEAIADGLRDFNIEVKLNFIIIKDN